MAKILQYNTEEEKILRSESMDVDFNIDNVNQIVADMSAALKREDDGVAIAAPQIGINKNIFVISEHAYDQDAKIKNLVFINPKIIKFSKKKSFMPEGCLSVRWLYGEVKRHNNVTVEAYDMNGKKFIQGAGGLIAQIIQHEIDHLHGSLFIDTAIDIRELTEEEVRGSSNKD